MRRSESRVWSERHCFDEYNNPAAPTAHRAATLAELRVGRHAHAIDCEARGERRADQRLRHERCQVGQGKIVPIPAGVIIFLICCHILLRWAPGLCRPRQPRGGASLRPQCASDHSRIYVVTGFFAGLGSARRSQFAGTGCEPTVIASVVIGGTSPFGGVGAIFGTVVGTLMIGVLLNGLAPMNSPPTSSRSLSASSSCSPSPSTPSPNRESGSIRQDVTRQSTNGINAGTRAAYRTQASPTAGASRPSSRRYRYCGLQLLCSETSIAGASPITYAPSTYRLQTGPFCCSFYLKFNLEFPSS
jgi:hypothetical protein